MFLCRFFSVLAVVYVVVWISAAAAQQTPLPMPPAALGADLAVSTPERFAVPASVLRPTLPPSAVAEHPLVPVLRWAKRDLPKIEALQDYSATLVMRECVRGKLRPYEYLFIKIRHEPLSIYAKFLAPLSVEGQEVVYVAGHNQGNMLVRRPNIKSTLSVHPEGMVAMSNRHYPLTEIGVVNLVRRLMEVGQEDLQHGDCEVRYFAHAKLNRRPCTVIEVVHPQPRDYFRFHLARIFVDEELNLPTRYESYDWPDEPGGAPQLIEEYTYLDLKLNNGFTDADFWE